MKQKLINDVVQGMLPFLNNAQAERLQDVLQHALWRYEVCETTDGEPEQEQDLVALFLSAKRIEGCSEKSLKYYQSTIQAMLDELGKGVKEIVTEDIRGYLTNYQWKKRSSRVTIDNIRRILSYNKTISKGVVLLILLSSKIGYTAGVATCSIIRSSTVDLYLYSYSKTVLR